MDDIQYHPHWQLLQLLLCWVAFYYCTVAEFAGKLISEPRREELVNYTKGRSLVNQATQYALSL